MTGISQANPLVPPVTPGPRPVTPADLRRAAWSSSLGSALEYYDFALYSLASALVFGPLFFPGGSPATGLVLSFGTYFVGFAVRPVGGILFGRLGDRAGRKLVLTTTVGMMGTASALIGLLPTYRTVPGDWYPSGVGILAPILLLVLRIVQGLGAGAEMSGASILMTEYAPARRRGYYAALPFMGIQVGTVAAALMYFVLYSAGKQTVTSSWLWRLPFLLSVVIIGAAVYLRLRLKESPTFARLQAGDRVASHPLRDLLGHSRGSVLRGIGLRLAENGSSSIYQALAIAYVTSAAVGVRGPIGALSLVFAASLGSVMVPVAGALSDRFGRVRVYRAFAVFELVSAFPIWWGLSQGSTVITIVVVTAGLGIGSWGMFGAGSSLLAELFGARHRYLGVAVTREVSAVVSGGVAPLIGAAIIAAVVSADGGSGTPGAGNGAWVYLGAYMAFLALITVAATFVTPETAGRDLEDPRDALVAAREG